MTSRTSQKSRVVKPKTARPERRRQADRSATTRRDLLNAAVECLGEVGYQHLTVDLVAQRASVSRGAVQHHFGSRDDLILAVVEDIGDALTLDQPMPVPGSRQVDALIDHGWAVLSSPHFIAVIQIWLAERGNPGLFEKIRKTVTSVERQLDERWTDTFQDAELSAQAIVALRHVVIAALRGLALRTLYSDDVATSRELQVLKQMAGNFIQRDA